MSAPKDHKAAKAPKLTDDEVLNFLRAHPDFLVRYPTILDVLTPPDRLADQDTSVADMQAHMIRRLRDQLASEAQKREALMANALLNSKAQGDAHAAVLALMAAKSMEEALSVIVDDWPGLLKVDVITIAAEVAFDGMAHEVGEKVFSITHGTVDALLGAGEPILLTPHPKARDEIYGTAAPLVQSDALIRLAPSKNAPVGILALGSREAELFEPGQATDLLQFLGGAVERSLRLWLDLP